MKILLLALLVGLCHCDKPSSSAGYGAPAPQIKYGGPIVYSGEKPPIIHFPPPPAQVHFNTKHLKCHAILISLISIYGSMTIDKPKCMIEIWLFCISL